MPEHLHNDPIRNALRKQQRRAPVPQVMQPEPVQASAAPQLVPAPVHVARLDRRAQHWEPPGGVLELNETIHDGLRREIREETGLDIEPDALTGVYKNMPRGIIALVFRCKITGGHLTANDEVTAFRWADQADIRQFTSEAYAVRLLDALREGAAPAIRQHDGTELLG
jgi:8-oxo-dGTP diphosphatase